MSVLDLFRLDGQVAVVTGAGRGIGAATAVALAEAGADVVLAARTAGQLRDTAGAIEAAGRKAHMVVADLSDLAPRIRVNAIAAGTIATAATEPITGDPEFRSRVETATPLRRLGTTADVAAAVVYLASPAGSYLTGAVLEVHGGLQAPSTQPPLPDL
jgi:7-alpha-hydroxysteroid dehydrogenase